MPPARSLASRSPGYSAIGAATGAPLKSHPRKNHLTVHPIHFKLCRLANHTSAIAPAVFFKAQIRLLRPQYFFALSPKILYSLICPQSARPFYSVPRPTIGRKKIPTGTHKPHGPHTRSFPSCPSTIVPQKNLWQIPFTPATAQQRSYCCRSPWAERGLRATAT